MAPPRCVLSPDGGRVVNAPVRGTYQESPLREEVFVLAFILLLVIVCIALGIIGAVVHGLLWLLIIAALLFVGTLIFGGSRIRR
jgi:hypothetical protein